MAQKVSKKYALNISGVVNIDDDNRIWISVEDVGEFVSTAYKKLNTTK